MSAYQYQRDVIRSNSLEHTMRARGEEGWRLVHLHQSAPGEWWVFWEREISDENAQFVDGWPKKPKKKWPKNPLPF